MIGPQTKISRFHQLALPYIWPLIGAALLMTVTAAVEIGLPFLTGKIIDATLLDGGAERLKKVVFWFLGLCVIMGCSNFCHEYLISSTSARMLRDLRARLFNHLILLAPDFHESRRVGELLSRIGSDLTTIQSFLTGTIPTGIRAMVSLCGVLTMLFFIHARLTLVALIVIPPVSLAAVGFGRMMRKLATRQQDALADTSVIGEEVFNGIRTVQSAGRESFESGRYWDKLGLLLGIQLKNARLLSSFGAMLSVAQHVASVMVLWYGGRLIIRQELTAGQLVSFMLYVAAMGGLVGFFGRTYTGYQALVGASTRVFELLDTSPSIQDSVDATPLSLARGHVTFQHVGFQYPASNKAALENIHMDVQPGEVIGLVGPSGAGKSTLFSLLLRFYDPSKGGISIDGRDIRSIRLRDLRQSIAIVPQDIFLFNGTVAENISYFKTNATPEEVRAAAMAAGADEFISKLSNGYQEIVGQRGIKLSTGQRQRIAIARAFITKPAILLLDEATSSLDPDSEEKVKQALAKLLQARTTFVIAHRLTTARQANRILVMDGGRIVGMGSHDELYKSNPLYRRYWTLQSLREGDHTDAFSEPNGMKNAISS